MDGLVIECPVCTLYLRQGISLRQHLDTHPKDQVIEALLRTATNSNSSLDTTNSVHQNSALPATPLVQQAPHLTTAVTYQQILTTNASGAVVPQFLQIPTFVNPPYAVGQNFGFSPSVLNPVQNSFVAQQYSFNGNQNDDSHLRAIDANEHQDKGTLGGDEMDLESSEPTTPSVIISRSNSSPTKSVTSPKTSRISAPQPTSERTTPLTPASNNVLSSPRNSPHSNYTIFCPINRDELPNNFKIDSNDSRDDLTPSPRGLLPSPIDEHDSYHSSDSSHHDDSMFKAEDSVIVEAKPQSSDNSYKTDVKMECFEIEKSIPPIDPAKTIAEEYVENDSYHPYSDVAVDQNSSGAGYFTTNPVVEQGNSGDAVYTDLMPSSASHIPEDLTTNNHSSYMELDGIRIFFNNSTIATEKSSSVIHMADSTKMDMSPINLNIAADESMPARGELSEQESMCADSAWGIFNEDVKPIETWSRDTKAYKCSACDLSFFCPKERRVHKNQMHGKPGKSFRCTTCNAVFRNLRERREHAAVHDTVKVEKTEEPSSTVRHCRHCPTVLPTLRALRTHLSEAHGMVRYRCRTCEKAFDDEQDFNEHLKVHPLKCTQCDKMFYRRTYLNLHMKRHLAVKPFNCNICPKSFITRQKLDEHVNGHAGIKPIKCMLCDKTFSRHSNLIQHRNLHHNKLRKKSRDYICRCGEVFQSQRKLEWHREIHDTKPKSCPYCSQKFIHASSVTRHVRRAHFPDYLPEGQGRESENVSCPLCDRVYLRSSLSVHMRVHKGEKPFHCKICTKQFTTKWNMELHQWTHQSRSAMPFKCTQCKSAFFRESDYTSHVNAHRNLKPFICNICGQKFIRKYNCLRHQEEHRRAKKFTCTVAGCERTFHRSYYLKDHMKVHTGVRPHTCHICGKASSTKSNHNKHVRIHDTREPINTEN